MRVTGAVEETGLTTQRVVLLLRVTSLFEWVIFRSFQVNCPDEIPTKR